VVRAVTFASKLGAGFALVIVLVALVAFGALHTLSTAAETQQRLADAPSAALVALGRLRHSLHDAERAARRYLRSGGEPAHAAIERADLRAAAQIAVLKREVTRAEGRRLLAATERAEEVARSRRLARVEQRRAEGPPGDAVIASDPALEVALADLDDALDALATHLARRLHLAKREALLATAHVRHDILLAMILGVLLAGGFAFTLTRLLAGLHHEVEAAVQARDEFISIASHELRTPLTTLKLATELGLRIFNEDYPDGPPEIRDSLERVRLQTARLTRLVSQLLDVSRLTAGRLVLDREAVDLAAVVRDQCAFLEGELARAGCDVRLQLADGVVGQWDRLRIEQVVANLVGNAAKYGAGAPVEVTLEAARGRARLRVTDWGIGIDHADQGRIFRRFERVVDGSGVAGFGLGLWIAREVVEAHGGTINVVSAPGAGASFVVELPLAATAAEASGAAAPPAVARAPEALRGALARLGPGGQRSAGAASDRQPGGPSPALPPTPAELP
jgi:signal transduction histidine kinase